MKSRIDKEQVHLNEVDWSKMSVWYLEKKIYRRPVFLKRYPRVLENDWTKWQRQCYFTITCWTLNGKKRQIMKHIITNRWENISWNVMVTKENVWLAVFDTEKPAKNRHKNKRWGITNKFKTRKSSNWSLCVKTTYSANRRAKNSSGMSPECHHIRVEHRDELQIVQLNRAEIVIMESSNSVIINYISNLVNISRIFLSGMDAISPDLIWALTAWSIHGKCETDSS